jgi:hypothetical protein
MNADSEDEETSFALEYYEEAETDVTEASNQVSTIVPEMHYKFEELREPAQGQGRRPIA